MCNTNSSSGNTLPNEVKINFHMFGALMLDRVGRHINCADIITINQSGATDRRMQLC